MQQRLNIVPVHASPRIRFSRRVAVDIGHSCASRPDLAVEAEKGLRSTSIATDHSPSGDPAVDRCAATALAPLTLLPPLAAI